MPDVPDLWNRVSDECRTLPDEFVFLPDGSGNKRIRLMSVLFT